MSFCLGVGVGDGLRLVLFLYSLLSFISLQNPLVSECLLLLGVSGVVVCGRRVLAWLKVGLNTGVMIRSSVDPVTGSLSDQRTRFLGGRAARFHLVRMGNKRAVMALSEKSWLSFFFQGKFHSAPLHYDPLECVASFSSEQVRLPLPPMELASYLAFEMGVIIYLYLQHKTIVGS